MIALEDASMRNMPVKVISASSVPLQMRESVVDEGTSPHSLHFLAPFREHVKPSAIAYFIEQLSGVGDVVLDPFTGSGVVGLEALLAKRQPLLSDPDLLGVVMTEAKLCPADLSALTLTLQTLDLQRPVSLDLYQKGFSCFYDIDTFREIVAIRQALQGVTSRSSLYCRALVASLLHGHTAGYLSVYSFPHVALCPRDQEKLSLSRRASPSYRAVIPRVLRKAAFLGRDCTPSMFLRKLQPEIVARDPRHLKGVPDQSVDLVITSPSIPGSHDWRDQQWLRRWFFGFGESFIAGMSRDAISIERYLTDFRDELARVTKPGGYAVLFDREEEESRGKRDRPRMAEIMCERGVFRSSWLLSKSIPLLSRPRRIGHNGTTAVLKPTVAAQALVFRRGI
jgi:hypothetical protein